MSLKTISLSELSTHNKESDLWIAIDGHVYDVTKFASVHPGGKKVLVGVGGGDASSQFAMFHKPETLKKYHDKFVIGKLDSTASTSSPSSTLLAKLTTKPKAPSSSSSSRPPPSSSPASFSPSNDFFGDSHPYSEPNWYHSWKSPYYKDSHRRFRAAIREFVDKEITPFCFDWDESKKIPLELYKKAYSSGWLPGVVGFWPKIAGNNIAGGVKVEEWDYFHELILLDEIGRCGSGGVLWGILEGLQIGLPPVLNYGSQHLQSSVAVPCLKGEEVICLCITEPSAGSDVANLQCSAKKTDDGKFYIVNGEKKWITNGTFARYFTVAVRTSESGMGGISLLLIDRQFGGVTTRQMQCSGMWASGTAYVTFEDCKVPVEYLIGKENEGFKYVMNNFNHERWGFAVQANRFARVCIEESLKYALKRRTFGKLLIEHPVIRLKLAHMSRQVESLHAWLENITFQLNEMTKEEANKKLAGPIALLKAHSSTVFEYVAREATQIFGGLAYTRGGQGEKVERLYREVRALAIPAGSEEILLDLGVRQAVRQHIPQPKAPGKARL